MELSIFARFHAREEQEDVVAAALRDEVESARAEPGCLAHQAYRSTRDPRLFLIHSRWTDEAAFDMHAELAHTVRFIERVQPLIDHELEVTRAVSLVPKTNEERDHSMKYFAVTRERGPAWNRSLAMREQAKWTEHAAFMNRLAEEGFVVLGGPVGDEAKAGFSRALFVVNADSERTIEMRLEADPWTQMRILRTKIEPWEILLEKDRSNCA
jgi:quinol monooxygenase YgiN/uncharacterized protein YciI